MVGRKILGQVDRRLRQVFPHRGQEVFGGCSCLLFGDFGQLPPVMDLPLYTTDSRSELSDQGRAAYHQFNQAVVLNQVMRQAGQDPEQVQFRDILLRLRDAKVTVADWKCLMTQTPTLVQDLSPFANALHLNPTVEAVVEYNVSQLRASSQPIATIKAVHTGANASTVPADDAGGLEAVICLARSARVMLTSNLWVDVGLVNGAMGTIRAICYRSGGPPDLPISVMVHFDNYSGPTLHDGTVPITPLRRTWSSSRGQCSRLQLPLKLAWAVTIHKSQGLTLDKVVIDVGKREYSSGLTFVACSRVRQLKDLLFTLPFPLQRLANLANSQRLRERQEEDVRLLSLHVLPPTDHSIPSSSSTLHTPMGFNRPPPPPSSSPLSIPTDRNPPHLPPSSSPLSTPTDRNPPHLPPSSSPLSTPTDRNPPHLPPSSSPLSTPMGLNPPHLPPSSSPLSTPMGLSPPPLPPSSSPISIYITLHFSLHYPPYRTMQHISSLPCNFQFTPALIPALQFPVHPYTHPCPAISSSPLHSSLPCNFQFTPALIPALQFPAHPCTHPCPAISSSPLHSSLPCNFQLTPALIPALQFPAHPCTHPCPAISSTPVYKL